MLVPRMSLTRRSSRARPGLGRIETAGAVEGRDDTIVEGRELVVAQLTITDSKSPIFRFDLWDGIEHPRAHRHQAWRIRTGLVRAGEPARCTGQRCCPHDDLTRAVGDGCG